MTQVNDFKSTHAINIIMAVALVLMTILISAAVQAGDTKKLTQEAEREDTLKGEHNGQVMLVNGQPKAWEATSQQWLNLDSFWQNWADNRGGITWGRSKDYPPYEQINEQDTLLIELESGTCMMEFWHSRWRRANDVRRWDDAFNTYSACNKVFD